MNIIVTGSAGFVASDLIPRLNALGHTTIGIDVNDESLSTVFIKHDLTEDFCDELPKAEMVIHLASSVGGIIYNFSKNDIIEINNRINQVVIDLCLRSGCSGAIFFSTINVFEDERTFLHQKISKMGQKSGYAISKVHGEWAFARAFARLVVIRPTNIFGKCQIRRHERIGESHVIPDLLKKIDESDELFVMGDGSQIRNFVHVNDITRFVAKNLDFRGHQYWNLRSDITLNIKRLAYELLAFRNKKMTVSYQPEYMKYELFRIADFEMDIPNKAGYEVLVNSISQGLQL